MPHIQGAYKQGSAIVALPPGDIERLRHDFHTATEMDRLLRWWWSDLFTRHIHPSSQITVHDFVRRRIREVLDWPDDKVKASILSRERGLEIRGTRPPSGVAGRASRPA